MKKLLGALSEIGLELLVYAIGLGAGALILWACGANLFSHDTDYELVALLGLAFLMIIIVAGYFLTQWVRKRLK